MESSLTGTLKAKYPIKVPLAARAIPLWGTRDVLFIILHALKRVKANESYHAPGEPLSGGGRY